MGKGNKAVLIIPSTTLGPAWLYKLIDQLFSNNISVYAMVSRNYDIPFYRPDNEMRLLKNWDLNLFMQDVQRTIDYLESQKKQVVVITWGDGFDITLATLCKSNYSKSIKGLIALNPSILAPNNKQTFSSNVNYYDNKSEEWRYDAEELDFFTEIKTLSDLAVLLPESKSPYKTILGWTNQSNYDLFINVINKADHADFSLMHKENHFSMQEFHYAFMQPLPVFSILVPFSLSRDINQLWLNDFNFLNYGIIHKDDIDYPLSTFYSANYQDSTKRIYSTFPKLQIKHDYFMDNLSTIELLLSDQVQTNLVKCVKELY